MVLTGRAALASAVRAPSPHNTQPWRFVVEPDLVAVIRLDGNEKATAVERRLAEAVSGGTPTAVRCRTRRRRRWCGVR